MIKIPFFIVLGFAVSVAAHVVMFGTVLRWERPAVPPEDTKAAAEVVWTVSIELPPAEQGSEPYGPALPHGPQQPAAVRERPASLPGT